MSYELKASTSVYIGCLVALPDACEAAGEVVCSNKSTETNDYSSEPNRFVADVVRCETV